MTINDAIEQHPDRDSHDLDKVLGTNLDVEANWALAFAAVLVPFILDADHVGEVAIETDPIKVRIRNYGVLVAAVSADQVEVRQGDSGERAVVAAINAIVSAAETALIRPTESVRRIKLLAPTFAKRWLAELLSVVYADRDDVILRQTADRIRHADNRTYVDLLLGELGPRVKTPITVTSRAGSLANMLAATNDDDLARAVRVANLTKRLDIAEVADPAGELSVDGTPVPTVSCRYVDVVEDLPGAQKGVVYVVSRVLASVVPRGDIYFPYDEVRDHTGAIIGCRSLAQFAGSSQSRV